MADNKMNDDLDRKLGGSNDKNQQAPSRSNQDDEPFGQRGGGQGTSGRDNDDMGSQKGNRGSQSSNQNDQSGHDR